MSAIQLKQAIDATDNFGLMLNNSLSLTCRQEAAGRLRTQLEAVQWTGEWVKSTSWPTGSALCYEGPIREAWTLLGFAEKSISHGTIDHYACKVLDLMPANGQAAGV